VSVGDVARHPRCASIVEDQDASRGFGAVVADVYELKQRSA